MTNYVKYIDENTIEFAPLNKDGIFNYNIDIDRMEADGYLPLYDTPMPLDNKEYEFIYIKEDDKVIKGWKEIEVPLDILKSQKKAWIKSTFDSFYNSYGYCMSSLGFEIDATLRSKSDVQGLIDIGEEPITFRDWNNEYHTDLTLADMEILKLDISKYGRDLYAKKWELEKAVEEAQTPEELEQIVWD